MKNLIIILVSFFIFLGLIGCNLIEDADCKQQKTDETKCIRAFALYCANNRSQAECNGSIESILFIGSICKVGVECKSSSDDVVTEKIQPGISK
jgi:hypothetical protein